MRKRILPAHLTIQHVKILLTDLQTIQGEQEKGGTSFGKEAGSRGQEAGKESQTAKEETGCGSVEDNLQESPGVV